MIDLHEVMRRFIALGNLSVGMGPKHPSGGAREMQEEIDQFFARYPALRRDQGYVDFLEYYSAAAIDWPDEQLTIEIYGFSLDITLQIAYPEEPLLDNKGFYRFAEILVKPGPSGEKAIDGLYAFDVSESRKRGVYQLISVWSQDNIGLEYEWYSDTFLEWLNQVVEKQGRLF